MTTRHCLPWLNVILLGLPFPNLALKTRLTTLEVYHWMVVIDCVKLILLIVRSIFDSVFDSVLGLILQTVQMSNFNIHLEMSQDMTSPMLAFDAAS